MHACTVDSFTNLSVKGILRNRSLSAVPPKYSMSSVFRLFLKVLFIYLLGFCYFLTHKQEVFANGRQNAVVWI